MKIIKKEITTAFSLSELREAEFQVRDISLYKNVLVCWDEDYDVRIITFVDSLPDYIQEGLLACQEREGGLFLLWKEESSIPDLLKEGDVEVEGDSWGITNHSLE